MRLVIENSETEVARHEVTQAVGVTLRELATNLLRVACGAGQANELPDQAIAFAAVLLAYRDITGHFPPDDALRDVLYAPSSASAERRED